MEGLLFDQSGQCQEETTKQTQLPTDAAKRRSRTFPLLTGKLLPLKHSSIDAAEDREKPKTPKRREPEYTSSAHVNEYTVSFDLEEDRDRAFYMSQSNRPKGDPREKTKRPNALKSQSLINLPNLLKKDRTQIHEEEVILEEDNLDDRPKTNHSHRRQKSLPIHLLDDEVARKKEERGKRRQTFIGFFKKFS